ncbi:MAG: 50S ribosomal protein L23 [Patescibacteria group bacterium]
MSAFNLFKNSETKPKTKRSVTKKAKPEVIAEAPVVVEKAFHVAQASPLSSVLHIYVSEKASRLESFNQYVFKVAKTANKPEVKKAIESKFDVSVIAIRMVNMPSKKRTVGGRAGTKAGFRKAIVKLAKGDTINSAKS